MIVSHAFEKINITKKKLDENCESLLLASTKKN